MCGAALNPPLPRLLVGGWDQTSSRASPNDRHACPTPKGAQISLPPRSQAQSSLWDAGYEDGAFVDDAFGDDDDATVAVGSRPEVTFVVSVLRREGVTPIMASSVALEAAIALFRHADVRHRRLHEVDALVPPAFLTLSLSLSLSLSLYLHFQEVPPSEFIFVDHTASSSASGGMYGSGLNSDGSLDLTELEEFLSFLQHAFGLNIRLLRHAPSGDQTEPPDGEATSSLPPVGALQGGGSYLDLIAGAAKAGSGRLLCLVEAENILQPGALRALHATLEAFPEVREVEKVALAPRNRDYPARFSQLRRQWWCPNS